MSLFYEIEFCQRDVKKKIKKIFEINKYTRKVFSYTIVSHSAQQTKNK